MNCSPMGEASVAEAAGNRDGREPRGVHRARVARYQTGTGAPDLLTLTTDHDGVGVDAGCRQGRRRGYQEVYFLQNPGVFFLDDSLNLHRLE